MQRVVAANVRPTLLASSRAVQRRRRAVVKQERALAPPRSERNGVQQPAQEEQQQRRAPFASALATAALSVGLLLSGAPAPVPEALAAAAESPLADVVRGRYPGITRDPNGVVTRGDLEAFNEDLWLQWVEEGEPVLGNGDADYALKLFDLNQDGTVTPEEVLRALALDGAIDPRTGEVDRNVFEAFDANGNGAVDLGEWQAALGDLGPEGEGTKRYIFNRVDKLADAGGQLGRGDFSAAVQLAREVLLGSSASSGLSSQAF